jgi:CBS domain-containing protein
MRPITAADLMNPEVLTVREDMSVQELAAYLVDNEISGAPVEDREGRLVGVVSVVDVAAVASEDPELGPERGNPAYYGHGFDDSLSPEDLEDLRVGEGKLMVSDIMTSAVYAVPEDATVSEVASLMLKGHLHRVLVTRGEKVLGIISTSDLLGLLVDEESA